MKDLDEHSRACEEAFGLISGYMLFSLHELSTAAGSEWDMNDPDTMEIIVNKQNAKYVYELCKEIRSGYSVGLGKVGMAKIKAARLEAHRYLYEEANDPTTSIERKIELVRLTGKGKM
jgi:hypothetical protein